MDLHLQTFAVCESLCDWGETLCAVSPNPTTIITAGTSSVVCVWDVAVHKDKVTHMRLRQVGLCLIVLSFESNRTQSASSHTRKPRLLTLFPAFIRPHRRCDMPGCVRGPQHDTERLPWPHLYPVGFGGAELHHTVNRTHNERFCTGFQWPHCKFTLFIPSLLILGLLFFFSFSPLTVLCCSVLSFQSANSMWKKGFILLTTCTCTLSRFFLHISVYVRLGLNSISLFSKGEIASCAGPVLYLWNTKGQLLTRTDDSCGPQPDILCIFFTQRQEWDSKNVIVTGCADGIIRVKLFCMPVNNAMLAGWMGGWRSLIAGSNLDAHLGINNSIWVACDCMEACVCSPQSKQWTPNWASLGSGHPYHMHTNGIIALLLPWVMGRVWAPVHMWVCLLLCWIMSDFATRYVSLIQIWKTEYTRTQLPGPPEEPVSPGQDRTERNGNVTGCTMGYAYR